jgi:eukaryotic-like serine/threonine-protein kinase
VAISVVLVTGGAFYVRHEDARRAAELAPHFEGAPAPLPTSAPEAPVQGVRGAIDLTSKPDGCAIWVDGDLRSEVTPARLDKLPLGKPIKLKLTKEGFEAFRADVTLTDAEPTKQLAAEMKTGSVTVILKVDPPPTVWVDGQPWKGDRARIDGLSAGEDHKIVVSASGFQARTYTVNAQHGEVKTIADQLPRADGAGGVDKPAPDKPAPDKPAPDKPAPSGLPGKIRVGAKGGFCNVTVNGTSYGPTPVEATVPSGAVRISCKPANGPSQSQAVMVGPGETARVSFKVEE